MGKMSENVARARRRLRQLEKAAKIAGWTAGSALGIVFAFLGILTMIVTDIRPGIVLLLFGVGVIATMLVLIYQSSLNKQVSGRFLRSQRRRWQRPPTSSCLKISLGSK